MASKIAMVIAILVSRKRVEKTDNANHCFMSPSLKVAHIIFIHTPWEKLRYVDPRTTKRDGRGSTWLVSKSQPKFNSINKGKCGFWFMTSIFHHKVNTRFLSMLLQRVG